MKRYSIVQEDLTHCYLCGTTQNLHIHHIFPAANRKLSEEYHCIVCLCLHHHTGSNEAVHFNRDLDLRLKRLAQEKFEKVYPNLDFRSIFGKNYL